MLLNFFFIIYPLEYGIYFTNKFINFSIKFKIFYCKKNTNIKLNIDP